jgi:hypothetical protein
MTALAGRRDARVHVVTAEQARAEIALLLDGLGMTRDELERQGDAWALDADARGVLANIRGLEFLLERTAARE